MKEEVLKSLGLSSKEIKLYLASLQLGTSLVQNISKQAGLNRTSSYDLLNSLEEKGFVSYTISSNKKYYTATPPKKLLSNLKEKERMVEKIIPELISMSGNSISRPKVEVYSGKEGIKTIFEQILSESKEFCCMASKEQLFKIFEYYLPHFVEQRIENKIKVRIISEVPPYDKNAPYKLIKSKIKTAMWLYNGKIAMISLEEKEPIGILIDEKNFYETQKMMFDLLWDNL